MNLGKLAARRCRPCCGPLLLASPQHGWPLWGSPLRFATVGRETGACGLLLRSALSVTGAPGPPAGPHWFPDGPQGSCERRQSRAPQVPREVGAPWRRVARRDTWCMQVAASATVFTVHCERRLAPAGRHARPALTRRGLPAPRPDHGPTRPLATVHRGVELLVTPNEFAVIAQYQAYNGRIQSGGLELLMVVEICGCQSGQAPTAPGHTPRRHCGVPRSG
jgi:hypothetical protein